jgi:hypothetical protein
MCPLAILFFSLNIRNLEMKQYGVETTEENATEHHFSRGLHPVYVFL